MCIFPSQKQSWVAIYMYVKHCNLKWTIKRTMQCIAFLNIVSDTTQQKLCDTIKLAENRLFLKRWVVLALLHLQKKTSFCPQRRYKLSLCIAVHPSSLQEWNLARKFAKPWLHVHHCSLEISHCCAVCKFLLCLLAHPLCFVVVL